jgi:shikimate kinase
MAAGKTTAASLAAEGKPWQLVDLDRSIEEASGKSVAQIFTEDGEAAFRQIESRQLAMALKDEGGPRIIAAGGGVVLTAANQLLLKRACVIFLDTDFAEIMRRLQAGQSDRPLLRGLDAIAIRQLWQNRRQLYIKTSDFVVKDNAELIQLVNSKIQRG